MKSRLIDVVEARCMWDAHTTGVIGEIFYNHERANSSDQEFQLNSSALLPVLRIQPFEHGRRMTKREWRSSHQRGSLFPLHLDRTLPRERLDLLELFRVTLSDQRTVWTEKSMMRANNPAPTVSEAGKSMTDVEEKAQTTDDDSGQNVPKNRTELKRLRPLGSASLPRDYSKKSNPQKNRLISLKSFLFLSIF